MVVLEAAAIGAAGYGVYRGGEAVARKGKETIKEHRRERTRRTQRDELALKAKERKDRLAQLTTMRKNTGGGQENIAAAIGTKSLVSSSSTDSSSVLDRMRADHGKSAGNGGRFKGLFKKK